MRTSINTPEIAALREAVELRFGAQMLTPRDFTALSCAIEESRKGYLSESTLQRIWLYKIGYSTVAAHTLDILGRYAGYDGWKDFLMALREKSGEESTLFSGEGIDVGKLRTGTKIRISWRPDRSCIVRYLGNYRFEAIETENSKLSSGDTFSCIQMQKGMEMHLDSLIHGGQAMRYVIGTRNGLTGLEIMEDAE